MSLTATVRALVLAGATPEMILAVVETHEATVADALAKRRASDASRQQARRDREAFTVRQSRDVTLPVHGVTVSSPHVGECAQVVTPSLPSLRSEEVKNPPEKTSSSTPKGANQVRGTRLADDWEPPLGLIAGEFGLSHEQYADQVAIFRDYWRAVPGAKGRKADWPATWRNWLRRASENSSRKAHEQPHHDAKFDARQANLARAFAGADRAAGQRWKP